MTETIVSYIYIAANGQNIYVYNILVQGISESWNMQYRFTYFNYISVYNCQILL